MPRVVYVVHVLYHIGGEHGSYILPLYFATKLDAEEHSDMHMESRKKEDEEIGMKRWACIVTLSREKGD